MGVCACTCACIIVLGPRDAVYMYNKLWLCVPVHLSNLPVYGIVMAFFSVHLHLHNVCRS